MSHSRGWVEAQDALRARAFEAKSPLKAALIHLQTARAQVIASDDAIIVGHIDAAIRLLESA